MQDEITAKSYPMLAEFTEPVYTGGKPALGREEIVNSIRANLARTEISVACLLADPGTGKTAVVKQYVRETKDTVDTRMVDLSSMSAGDGNTDGSVLMAPRMTALANEAQRYAANQDRQLVLFMDEIHIVAQISPAAFQAIKPMLADSGQRGIKLIMATTFMEFRKYIMSDEALTQRMERITLPTLGKKFVLSSLEDMWKRDTKAKYEPIDRDLIEEIYDVTDRFIPSQKQPRKSQKILDAMLGWHREFPKYDLNHELLSKVMFQATGFKIDWSVNVPKVAEYLHRRVFDQELAIQAITQRLYISTNGLNDPTKPQGSFLFSGPTGVGKTELAKALSSGLFGDDRAMIRFDMSEYSLQDSVERFKNALTTAVWERPYSVILIDEIEKGHPSNSRLLLQVLDDARLSDQYGRTVAFNNAYVIATTNVGQDVYRQLEGYVTRDDPNAKSTLATSGSSLRSYVPLIRDELTTNPAFPTELVNRFDEFVPFISLDKSAYNLIALRLMRTIKQRAEDQADVKVYFSKQVPDYIAFEHHSTETDAGGARGLARRADAEITSKIGQYLANYPDCQSLIVRVVGNMAYGNKHDTIGSAYIQVADYVDVPKKEA